MEKNVTEDKFKKKGLELFNKLEQNAKVLEVDRAAYDESVTLIDNGRMLFTQGNSSESFDKYMEARNIIAGAISARSEPLAWRLFWIELAYLFVLLLMGYLTYRWPCYGLWKGIVNQSVQTAWFGALGGVTIAIYGIYSHVQQKDFDPKYELWYLCKPIIGAIFGWFVHLIFFLGLACVQDMAQDKLARPELAFLIAFLAGFSERFTIRMIDKLMRVLITWDGKDTKSY
jgi:hypothetical protein